MHNNILYNNPVDIIGEDINISHNFFSEEFEGEGNITGNPHFRNPSREVGIIENPELLDWKILSDSPCLDAGNNEVVGDLAFDFYGNTRIMDGNNDGIAIVDMGAYEMDGELFALEEIEKKRIKVYPNPSTGNLNLQIDDNISLPLKLEIYDVSGAVLNRVKLNDFQSVLNLNELNTGIYILKIFGEDIFQREILIIQKN